MILNTGDIVVLGVDDTNTGNYRVTGFEFDVGASTATAVPEPSSFLTTSAALLAFGCFVRRRRKVASDIAGSD